MASFKPPQPPPNARKIDEVFAPDYAKLPPPAVLVQGVPHHEGPDGWLPLFQKALDAQRTNDREFTSRQAPPNTVMSDGWLAFFEQRMTQFDLHAKKSEHLWHVRRHDPRPGVVHSVHHEWLTLEQAAALMTNPSVRTVFPMSTVWYRTTAQRPWFC